MDASEDSDEINVEVELEGDADDEGLTRVKAVYLNPYTCTFRAPGTNGRRLFSIVIKTMLIMKIECIICAVRLHALF